MCANACPSGKYVYEVSANLKLCVDSCKDLNPTAYIDEVTVGETIIKKCSTSCIGDLPKIDATDINNPKCASTCPDGAYIDTLTYVNKVVCVSSCKNLIPIIAYIDPNNNKCTRFCPAT